ncbi:MAG: LapA family protein [Nitrospinota bacterium]|nr:LapA family protein [Nitrospinota bacterium]
MVALKFLFALAILIVLVLFALQNMEPSVIIKYYLDKTIGPMPFSFAVLGAAAIGSIITALVTLVEQIKLRHTIKKLSRRIKQQDEELLNFKKIPPEPIQDEIEDEHAETSAKSSGSKLLPGHESREDPSDSKD